MLTFLPNGENVVRSGFELGLLELRYRLTDGLVLGKSFHLCLTICGLFPQY